MTFEEILKRALSRVPNDMDKREGSPIYLALAPACFELAEAYMQIEAIRDMTFADTSKGEDLTRRCAERGIYRKNATHALRKGIFNTSVPIGARFRIEETTYSVVRKIDSTSYELQCEQYGRIGNDYVGTLLPIEYIKNLVSAQLTDVLVPGEEVEDDELLRKRYFDSLESEAYGGNTDDYKQKTKSIDGVGAVKVYPVWNGPGTVKLIILDTTYSRPSVQLINNVQNIMDPIEAQGEGYGIAPIGHNVTVEGASETIINIACNITLQDGYLWEDIQDKVREVIEGYFDELNRTWENTDCIVVRVSYIDTRILNIDGVLDIQRTSINGSFQNVVLPTDNIAILGRVENI